MAPERHSRRSKAWQRSNASLRRSDWLNLESSFITMVANMPGRRRILFGFYMLTIFWLWAWRCDGVRLVMEAARARVQEAFGRAPANLLAFWAPAAWFTRQR